MRERKAPSLFGKRIEVERKAVLRKDSASQRRETERRKFAHPLKPKGSNPKDALDSKESADLRDKNKRGFSDKRLGNEKNAAGSEKNQATEKTKNDEACAVTQASPAQIASAQQNVNNASQKVTNLVALSGYSAVDIENKATEIYNDAKNMGYYGAAQAIPYIEQQLSERYGIPMGTLTDSLKVSFSNKPDKYVPGPIQSALTQLKNNGSAIPLAKQDLDQATQNLQNLKEPKCVPNATPALPQPQPQTPPTFNILEMVTDSENLARISGNEGNVNVQMRILTTRIVGTDHGALYDQVYTVFLNSSFQWEGYNGKDKPTQYGFLTGVT